VQTSKVQILESFLSNQSVLLFLYIVLRNFQAHLKMTHYHNVHFPEVRAAAVITGKDFADPPKYNAPKKPLS
jgi:hypothetical protein